MPQNLTHLLTLIPEPAERVPADVSAQVAAFIARWKDSGGQESANSQPFFQELFSLFGPAPKFNQPGDVSFEQTVRVAGSKTPKRMDVYRRGVFVIEAKQGSFKHHAKKGHGDRDSAAYRQEMEDAFYQGLRYAQHLPEGIPPVLMVVDIGYRFDIWTSFSGNFNGYASRGSFALAELADPEVFALLRDLLTEPSRRNPALVSARVTREVATILAGLAKELERSGHPSEAVSRFLMRCLFTMFAEDIGLLRTHKKQRMFETLLRDSWLPNPSAFPSGLARLWRNMDTGGAMDLGDVARFNGSLFKDATTLPLTTPQIQMLLDAAHADWSRVEPSIFGTLVERALSPAERHTLGAHYTPRAYIERLVRPTIEQPLRDRWTTTQAQVKRLLDPDADSPPDPTATTTKPTKAAKKPPAKSSKQKSPTEQAIQAILAFKKDLASVRVLDPACGSGNFLYVTFDLLKQIELEVNARLLELGYKQQDLDLLSFSVTPAQFHGIEIKPWAREIAELVLWIGALQWHHRLRPGVLPAQPILQNLHPIERRDAVLSFDAKTPRLDPKTKKTLTIWDGVSTKPHPVTREPVPDESKQIPLHDYTNPRPAPWPDADFIVGNPPFIGNWRMRSVLGHGYAETLRATYPNVPESCDYVMYWWDRAAQLLQAGKIQRFGFITTNSLTQTFSRRVLQRYMDDPQKPISLAFAIPDHPWVDNADGAAVRIAMTCAQSGQHPGTLARVTLETSHDQDDIRVELSEQPGVIHPDLKLGANVSSVQELAANAKMIGRGVNVFGPGFIVTQEQAKSLGLGKTPGLEKYIRHYRNGRDVTAAPRGVMIIDLFGLSAEEAAQKFPPVYQHLFDHVKPERDQNNRESIRKFWWIFGWPRPELRKALNGLRRYIATVETAKHRVFQFLDASILPDNMLINIALDDAYFLGVLSSRVHVTWALAAGGRLGIGNDPRYNKTRCFDPFPFPECGEGQKTKIRKLAEELDAHRKAQQAAHPKLTITEMYNVLEKLRAGETLNDKDKTTNAQGLVSSRLWPLHQAIDQAVAEAYGWPPDISDEDILARLVDLNQQRRAEEQRGQVRWLRPSFQAPTQNQTQASLPGSEATDADPDADTTSPTPSTAKLTWPKDPFEQISALRGYVKAEPGRTLAQWSERLKQTTPKQQKALRAALNALANMGIITQDDDEGWA